MTARLGAELAIVGRAAWMAARRFFDGHDLTFASSIAYFSLLSLLPFFLLLFSLVGTVTAEDSAQVNLVRFVLRYFPARVDFVLAQLATLQERRLPLGIAGSLLLVWAALGVFGAITTAVNYAWGVETQPNYFKHKLVSFLMLAAAGTLLLAVLVVVSLRGLLEATALPGLLAVPGARRLTGIGSRVLTVVGAVVVAGSVCYFVPNTRVRIRDVWVGAILTGLLWRLSLFLFAWFPLAGTRPSIQGSLTAVITFLVWMYMSAAVLLYGVEFTAAHARLRTRAATGGSTPPRPAP